MTSQPIGIARPRGNGAARRRSYARVADALPVPDLIQTPLESFTVFQDQTLRELFDEISPVVSYRKELELYFPGLDEQMNREFGLDYAFGEPNYSENECRRRGATYSAPLFATVLLYNRETDQPIVQEVFMGDFPLMTSRATFIINGSERVVVGQLIRSPGAYLSLDEHRRSGRQLCSAKLIPDHGAWLEFDTSYRDVISVKVDRKRKMPVTVLLRTLALLSDGLDDIELGEGHDEDILPLFEQVDDDPEHPYLLATIARDSSSTAEEAILEFYSRLRPGDPTTMANAVNYLGALFFDPRRYDLGRVGRYKLSRKLGTGLPVSHRILSKRDLVGLVRQIIEVNQGKRFEDDIDDLSNRRVKTVGELIQNQLRIGFLRMERIIKERMSTRDADQMSPIALVNVRPVVGALRQFFGGSQLSQFMQQTNALDELTHKRTLSALGPGGLQRQHAGFDVRDVHFSHYGRICPIETPEGPNIGLIGRLSTFARINDYGFIETPYRAVAQSLVNDPNRLLGRTLNETVTDPDTDEVVAESGLVIDVPLAKRLAALPQEAFRVRPFVTDEITYLSADDEQRYTIGQASSPTDGLGQFLDDRVPARVAEDFRIVSVDRLTHVDVSPKQIVGVSASLVPFLEHDDANRALMGSNMQRQAVPLVMPEAPIVGTGMESAAALDSGQLVLAPQDGQVLGVREGEILIEGDAGVTISTVSKFERSNQSTCINGRAMVTRGETVHLGQPIADTSSTQNGELALGQNVLVAFMSWEGGNFEDAIVVSEELVRDDRFTSIHIEEYEVEARDTKLGPEEITCDIPNVSEDALHSLDAGGVVYLGAEVGPGDILVGKITPKGETTLSPEERLLRAIFGEKAREVRDSSLRLPHGEEGVVVDVRHYTRDEVPELKPGVQERVVVTVARRLKLAAGDKMAGRHGNKGVISRVVAIHDMPYLADGTPVQAILSPLGVPGRMNVGQVLETHLGWAAERLGMAVATPVSDGASEDEIAAELARAWLIDRAWEALAERAWRWLEEAGIEAETLRDDLEARQLYMAGYLGQQGYGLAAIDRVLNDERDMRRTWLRYWLAEEGYASDTLLAFEGGAEKSQDERARATDMAREACLRLWLRDRGEDSQGLSFSEVTARALLQSQARGEPLPTTGKMLLYDGATGLPYDQPVTVGVMYMLKLIHIVKDKVHARSTGPYSLVTQQPLGGKAQFGGQRLGEMEVWALEAYGAAHTLQEMLTIKSDDVTGRVKAYEAIVKGEPIPGFGIPESFRVMVKELQALGLSVEVITEEGERIQFGRNGRQQQLPDLGYGRLARFLEI
jgi:DNA-directed RNA polymerase subunit beta